MTKKKGNTKKKKKNDCLVKTFVIKKKFTKDQKSIFDFMTSISKNIFNTAIFFDNIYRRYKHDIYKELFEYLSKNFKTKKEYIDNFKKLKLSNEDIENKIEEIEKNNSEHIFEKISCIFKKKFDYYLNIKNSIQNNNKIIYKYILDDKNRRNITIMNNNFRLFINKIKKDLQDNKDLIFDEDNKVELFDNIIENIVKSIYLSNFNKTKNEIVNKIPCSIKNKNFIEQVKNNKCLFIETNKDITFNLKEKIENQFCVNLKSERNYIKRIIYSNLGENSDKLPSDLVINIIIKAQESISSFFSLKAKGIKCNFPKFLDKNGKFNLLFFERSKKEETINKKKLIRLTLGKYVAKNYLQITNNKKLVCLNENDKSEYKRYIDKKYLMKAPKKYSKSKYYNIKIDEKVYLVEKSNKNIINGCYLYVPKPNYICKKDDKIKVIEIVPIYNGYKYEIHYKYDEKLEKKVEDVKNCKDVEYISIDLGVKNLMTIYDPNGKQLIINGRPLLNINYKYNQRIDRIKSLIKKRNNKWTCKQIKKLLIKRENKINNYFNMIVKWMSKKYSTKKIVIGYNLNWKSGVNMGKKNNRIFYGIPYRNLLEKLISKMKGIGNKVELNEESYTSKCDSLAFEEVNKQEQYLGRRLKRGLFSSSIGKLLNADINGAINILRKYLAKNNQKLEEIKGIREAALPPGESLFNPIKINIFSEVLNKEPTKGPINQNQKELTKMKKSENQKF